MSPADQAHARADLIRYQLDIAHQKIIEAFQANDWKALDYVSWDAYFSAEFGECYAKLKLTQEARKEIVPEMRKAGMSTRAIGKAVGASQTTVVEDLKSGERKNSPAKITGTDGKSYAAVSKPRAAPVVQSATHSVIKPHRTGLGVVQGGGESLALADVPNVDHTKAAKADARRIMKEKGQDYCYALMLALEAEMTE